MDILNMKVDTVFGIIIILMLIILGVVTFHFYSYLTVGKGAVLDTGVGAGFKLMPYRQNQMQRMQQMQMQ